MIHQFRIKYNVIISRKVGLITMYIPKSKVFSLKIQMIAGFIFTSAAGFPLHFLYDWTGNRAAAAFSPVNEWSGGNSFVGLFSPVNESPWEHLKLIYFPILFFLIIQLIYLKQKRTAMPNLIWSTSLSALLAVGAVTAAYYTYSGIIGRNIMWIDISIFISAAALAYIFNYRMIKSHPSGIPGSKLAGAALLLALCALLVVFTFFTPHIPWFEDPTTGLYGLP